MPDEILELSEERLIRPFIEMAESIRSFVRSAPGDRRWSEMAYETVYRHVMDHTVDQPDVDISPEALIEIQGCVEFAAKAARRAPHHLQEAIFRAVLGHLLYRMAHPE